MLLICHFAFLKSILLSYLLLLPLLLHFRLKSLAWLILQFQKMLRTKFICGFDLHFSLPVAIAMKEMSFLLLFVISILFCLKIYPPVASNSCSTIIIYILSALFFLFVLLPYSFLFPSTIFYCFVKQLLLYFSLRFIFFNFIYFLTTVNPRV